MKIIPSLALSSAFLAILGTSAHAAITYVDAVEGSSGNTFATGGSLGDTTWVDLVTNSANSLDDQWRKRTGTDFGNGAGQDVFQASHETVNSDDMPELTTTISGLADGTYTIWTFYWDQVASNSQNWTISTGLTSGSLTTYSSTVNGPGVPAIEGATSSGVDTDGLAFTTTVLKIANAGNATQERRMYGINLGNVTVSGGSGTVNVFVDNNIGNGTGNRTWYDGVGYELVPEPSTALLGGLGALLLLRRRR